MKRNAIILSLTMAVAALSPVTASAHGDDDHAHDAAPAVNTANKPQRLPDGRVFVPKLTQFQLGVRTQLAQTSAAAKTIELNGHVVMNPNHGARVQASSGGRVSAPAGGLPLLGSKVKKGQILAWIRPAQGSYEIAEQQAQWAETRANLAQAEQTVARLRQLEGSVPRKDIEAAQAQLKAIQARSSALSTASNGEALRASLDGVLASSNVVNGQVIDPATILFEIVDPKGFLIEALAYDPAITTQIESAAFNGVPLRYLGGARALRDGALPLLFAPSEAMPLALGQVVKVIANTREQTRGVVLPASAIVKNTSNQNVVWVLEQAQVLRAVPVQPMPLDGQRVLVGQLKDGQRIVVQGANLINQIR
ncbi:efflux RND transporter periplasmic adaptor subunit [Deefgea piscis]|uniref:efflux RND transporter periplasmic adaptor subunit n=1 Tax=Deefgea piscis TaxID=2739061 RepID=UPI001C7FB4BE|nr:efflux RND transporter periplasmic adaptor subunit [Deefgea piscis]QZA82332.1 efflux RND transporter periplasmic adaptor subunit [Deefgea piscis]